MSKVYSNALDWNLADVLYSWTGLSNWAQENHFIPSDKSELDFYSPLASRRSAKTGLKITAIPQPNLQVLNNST